MVERQLPAGSLSVYVGCKDCAMTETIITVQGTVSEWFEAERATGARRTRGFGDHPVVERSRKRVVEPAVEQRGQAARTRLLRRAVGITWDLTEERRLAVTSDIQARAVQDATVKATTYARADADGTRRRQDDDGDGCPGRRHPVDVHTRPRRGVGERRRPVSRELTRAALTRRGFGASRSRAGLRADPAAPAGRGACRTRAFPLRPRSRPSRDRRGSRSAAG